MRLMKIINYVVALMITVIVFVIEESFYAWYIKKFTKYHPDYPQKYKVMNENIRNMNVTFDGKKPPSDAVWQKVDESRNKFFVYSAFLDKRSSRQWIVRIVGATKTKTREKVACVFYNIAGDQELVNGKIEVISENWNLTYSAIFIICNIKNVSWIPISVSVVIPQKFRANYKHISNHLLVNNVLDSEKMENQSKIAVCVKPLYNFKNSIQLIEFVELNKLLGIDHFTFYTAQFVGANVNCVLDSYMKQNIVSVHPWKLTDFSKTEIRPENMFAALNDCLYRNMFNSSYIVFIDVDEFIVPRFNATLLDLMAWLSLRYNTEHTSSFSFQNAFFYLQWPDDDSIIFRNEIEKNLITVQKTRRKVKLNPHKQRSKFIVKPRNVVEVGNHFVWKFFYNHKTLNVPSTIAKLNHYRLCEFGGNDCVHLLSTVDRTLHRYRTSLTRNVVEEWSSMQSECELSAFSS